MAHPSWGNGWPNCNSPIVPLVVYGVPFEPGVHRDIHDLAYILLREMGKRERLHRGWCWGYACRQITNGSGPSNHSWGTAIDVNAPANGYGGTSHSISASEAAIFKRYGWRWGGDYTGTKDWMHLEYMGSVSDAKRHLAKAIREFGPIQDEEEEMYADYKKGWQKHADGKELLDDWPADQKFGWRARDQATSQPKPGDHEHTGDFATADHSHEHVHPVKAGREQAVTP